MEYPAELQSAVAQLMHAYADEANPNPETVLVICGMLDNYLDEVLADAQTGAVVAHRFDSEMLLLQYSKNDDVGHAKEQVKKDIYAAIQTLLKDEKDLTDSIKKSLS